MSRAARKLYQPVNVVLKRVVKEVRLNATRKRFQNRNALLKCCPARQFIVRCYRHPANRPAVGNQDIGRCKLSSPVGVEEVGLSDLPCTLVVQLSVGDILAAQKIETGFWFILAIAVFSICDLSADVFQFLGFPVVVPVRCHRHASRIFATLPAMVCSRSRACCAPSSPTLLPAGEGRRTLALRVSTFTSCRPSSAWVAAGVA